MAPSELRDKFAIVGVGITPTARTHAPGVSPLRLEAWAARLAIEDAGLRREDIDGAVHAAAGSPHANSGQWLDTYTRTLGIRPNVYLNTVRGAYVAHNGINVACQLLDMGLANYVIIATGLAGMSSAHAAGARTQKSHNTGLPMDRIEFGLQKLGLDAGASAAPTGHGFYASRHMYEYGTTHEQLGAVALSARAWAQLNPDARYYGRPATMEDYLRSRWVCYPYRTMDLCIQSDMGGALIVTTADRARDLRHKPIYIKGIGFGDQARDQWWHKSNYTQTDAAYAKRKAFEQAGVNLSDIDLATFYDCFTAEVIFYMEDYGWCKKGEGGPFVASGAIAPGGSIPVNTHGGLLAGMFMYDVGGVAEAVRQLRGEAGKRQVKGAEIALTSGHAGEIVGPGMCAIHGTMILGNVLS